MKAIWTLVLRVVMVFGTYSLTAGLFGLFQCGFPKPALIGTLMLGFIGFKALEALTPDKDKTPFPMPGEVERTLLVVSVVVGVIAGLNIKFC